VNGESQTRKEPTPSPFPLPCGERSSIYCFFLSPVGRGVLFVVSSSPHGERIEVRGKRKFLYYLINHSPFTKYDSPDTVTEEIVLRRFACF